MNTAVERGTISSSEAGLTSVESTNSLIRASMVMKAGIGRLATFESKLRTGLSSVLSGPTIYPSSSLRQEEYPSPENIDTAEEIFRNPETRKPENPLVKWALRFAIPGTGLFAACVSGPQDIDRPAIVEQAKPSATLAPGVGGEPIATFVPTSPHAGVNALIDRFNKGEQLTSDELNRVNTAKAAEAKAISEAQKPPTPNPDVKQKITSPEVWATAELIELPPNEQGQTLRYIGFNPTAGKLFSSPIPGQATKRENPKGFNGNRVTIFQPNNLRFSYTIMGDIEFLDPKTETNITEGHPLAKSRGTDTKNYGYAVLITATEFNDKDQDVTSDAALRELAPHLYETPPRKVSNVNPLAQAGPSKSSPIFLSTGN